MAGVRDCGAGTRHSLHARPTRLPPRPPQRLPLFWYTLHSPLDLIQNHRDPLLLRSSFLSLRRRILRSREIHIDALSFLHSQLHYTLDPAFRCVSETES